MVGAMAKVDSDRDDDHLLLRARTDADALGRLYERYYDRIFRFCVHRLFYREIAEDVTSSVFLQIAEKISSFPGKTERDFRNWLYAIASNHANAYIRKASRRKRLLEKAGPAMTNSGVDCTSECGPDWPAVYAAILKLKPKHQTIITLRFFENLEFEQIAEILGLRSTTVRVTVHRILKKLKSHLQTALDRDQ